MLKSPADTLLELLDQERNAIRAGHLTDLAAFATQKTTLVQAMLAGSPSRQIISRIDNALRRNARLLSAVCDGIRSAQTRMVALQDVRDGLSLYTAAGNRKTVAQRPDALEHKV